MSSLKRKASEIEDVESPLEDEEKRDPNISPTVEKDTEKDIQENIEETKTRIKQKQEVLRKLRLVQMYRNKPEMQDLDSVTSHWLQVCQEALQDLLVKVREQMTVESGEEELTLTLLVNKLGLDPELLKLDSTEDCFKT